MAQEKVKKRVFNFLSKNKIEVFLLAAIIFLAAFFRLWRLPDYMTFLGDEGRDALAVYEMITQGRFRLIGPPTSIGQMYLGPLYYYLMLPALFLSGLNPVGPAAMVVLFGLATVFLVWWVGREFFNRRVGLFAAALYALAPVVIVQSRSSWNPNVMPFFALLTIWATYQFWRKRNFWWLGILGLGLSFALQSHYLGLLLVPTVGIFWLLTLKDLWGKKQAKKRQPFLAWTLVSGVFFTILTVLPLIWFDLRHNFINYQAFHQFFTVRQTTVNLKIYKAIPNLWPLTSLIFTRLVAAKEAFWGPPVALATIFGLAGYLWQKRKGIPAGFWLLLVWFILALTGLGVYKQHIYDHYFGFFFPAPFLFVGIVLDWVYQKKALGKMAAVAAFAGLVLLSLQNSPLRAEPNYQLQRTKEISQFINQQSGDQSFNLALLAKQNYDAGYRYFLVLEGAPLVTPHELVAEQLFVVCELPKDECQPIGNPLWEIAAFGWAEIENEWDFPWGVRVYRLVHPGS